MVAIRLERPADVASREALLDVAYGPVRFTKTSERLREGRLPELAFVATEGRGGGGGQQQPAGRGGGEFRQQQAPAPRTEGRGGGGQQQPGGRGGQPKQPGER